ncbi:MAG: hypothetical protein QOE70_6831 [Chthoniobacter sp.]|jgi:hypothetical protein|nr:hypothetical protein [Chthoniobacter sp.]
MEARAVSAVVFQGPAIKLRAVKKLSKAILIAVGAVLVLGLALLFGINLYLQSPGVQIRIQEEISRALRVPLAITNSSLTPWSDLRITGITIPNGGTNLLEASSFRARYRFWPLLRGTLIIYDMRVEDPKIVWSQNAEGKWVLPKVEKPASKAAAAEAKISPTAVVASATPPEPVRESEVAKPLPTKKKSGLKVVVEGCQLLRGSVQLLDRAQLPVATITDLNINYTVLTPERVEGTIEIGRTVWSDTFVFKDLRSPFVYADGKFDFPQLTGKYGDGPLSGSLQWDSTDSKSPFVMALKFDQVNVAGVTTELGWAEGQASGTLGGTLDLHGSSKQIERAEGRAKLNLQNGRFREFSYFEMIGQALQIRQLSDLRLTESSADIRIADEKAFIESLTLNASDLQLNAKGVARFDGKLQINARLIAQDGVVKQLPSLVHDNFATGENDTRYIDFNITGKTSKPKTDLLDKIVGQKLEAQFDELVSSIFGSKKKKPDDKKSDDKKVDDKPKDQDKAGDDSKKAEKKKKKKKDEKDAAAKAPNVEQPTAAPAPAAPPSLIGPPAAPVANAAPSQ